MTIRATDISRYLGDAGHTPYRPIADDDTRPGRLLAVADPNTAATGQSGYRSEQVDRATVRTFHEGLHVQDRLRLYAIALRNLGYTVEQATHKGKPCLLVRSQP